jgi:hypothetical protein
MLERGHQLGLAQKPLPKPLVSGQSRVEEFKSDRAVAPRVAGAVDSPCPGRGEQGLDPVASELGADQRIR